LGVRLVCDLRSPQERTKHPLRWVGEPPRIAELAILPDVRTAGAEIMRSIAEDRTGGYARNLLLENYAAMPAAFEDGFRSLVESILDQGELPLLISCTAGKDRTGFVCAVLLRAVGVAHEDVVVDYLQSNDVFDAEGIRVALSAWLDSPRDLSEAVLDALKVHAEYLGSAFAAIERSDGNLDTYLERTAGLDRRRRHALRAALLS
jgi:protein-tyrosine phosphatase